MTVSGTDQQLPMPAVMPADFAIGISADVAAIRTFLAPSYWALTHGFSARLTHGLRRGLHTLPRSALDLRTPAARAAGERM